MSERNESPVVEHADDDRRWGLIYAAVIGELALLVFLMWIFTNAFDR